MPRPDEPQKPPGAEAPRVAAQAGPSPAAPPQILVIDDVAAHRALIEQALTKRGYQVRGAVDGQTGYDLAVEAEPDIVLLDLTLPDEDGFTVCERLKARSETAHIPVIILTAKMATADKVRAFQLGAADYITKPFQIAEVIARVETQLRIKRYEDRIRQYQEELEVTLAGQQLLTRQAVLSEEKASIRLLAVESALDAILIGDRKMRVQHANPAAAEVYGRTEEDLLGLELAEICRGAGTEEIGERLSGDQPFDREAEQQRADGSTFFAHIRGVSIRGAADHTLGYVVVVRDISHQKEMERQLERLATTDQLTDLANRRTFDLRLAEELSRTSRHGSQVGLAILDVDNFKQLNDTYGHQAGDSALALIAYVLASSVRAEDTVCRYGGEEFAIIAPETGARKLAALCERLRATMAATPVHKAPDGTEVKVTLTAGVSCAEGAEKSFDQLVREADSAMYEGKAAGRDRVVTAGTHQTAPSASAPA